MATSERPATAAFVLLFSRATGCILRVLPSKNLAPRRLYGEKNIG